MDSGIREIFYCRIRVANLTVDPESWALESGVQLEESGIPLRTGNRNPSITDKESGIYDVKSRSKFFLDSLTWAEQNLFLFRRY